MTSIEWTDATWNPIVGCSIVSPGCTHCYAMKQAARIQKMNRTGGSNSSYVNHYDGTTKVVNGNVVWTGKVALASDETVRMPLGVRRPTKFFVNSMGDLFHESVPDAAIDRVFAVMAVATRHIFQILTKRHERMLTYMTAPDLIDRLARAIIIQECGHADADQTVLQWDIGPDPDRKAGSEASLTEGKPSTLRPWPLPNVWFGVSAEDQPRADERIPLLLQTPAAVRFVSLEPLLGPIDLTRIRYRDGDADIRIDSLTAEACVENSDSASAYTNDVDGNTRLDWVIVGGESGAKARPMHPDWVRSLRDQCAAADVPFFFKQWGEWAPGECAPGPQTRTERVAYLFENNWDFGSLSPKVSEETHADDGPDVWWFGKKRAGRLLDGVEHNAMPVRS